MLLIELRTRTDAERLMRRRDELRTTLDAAEIDIYPATFLGKQVEEIRYP